MKPKSNYTPPDDLPTVGDSRHVVASPVNATKPTRKKPTRK